MATTIAAMDEIPRADRRDAPCGAKPSPKIELGTTCTKAREIWLSDDFARPLASTVSF